jgi:hypothetical protein
MVLFPLLAVAVLNVLAGAGVCMLLRVSYVEDK